jgi:hypothetical protein
MDPMTLCTDEFGKITDGQTITEKDCKKPDAFKSSPISRIDTDHRAPTKSYIEVSPFG